MLLLVAAKPDPTHFGFTVAQWIALAVGLFFGTGAVFKLIDLWRSRPRFKFHERPFVTPSGEFRTTLVQKGGSPGFIAYADVVVVTSFPYAVLHKIFHWTDELWGGISVLTHPIVEVSDPVEVKQGQPKELKASIDDSAVLPTRWSPWTRMTVRAPRVRELRFKLNSGQQKRPSYIRVKERAGCV